MKSVTVEFSFEVGDIVEHKALGNAPLRGSERWNPRPPERVLYSVVEQHVQICYAQCVQIQYHCRPVHWDGTVNAQLVRFVECELQHAREVVLIDDTAVGATTNAVANG